jgi:hypothetical protein
VISKEEKQPVSKPCRKNPSVLEKNGTGIGGINVAFRCAISGEKQSGDRETCVDIDKTKVMTGVDHCEEVDFFREKKALVRDFSRFRLSLVPCRDGRPRRSSSSTSMYFSLCILQCHVSWSLSKMIDLTLYVTHQLLPATVTPLASAMRYSFAECFVSFLHPMPSL